MRRRLAIARSTIWLAGAMLLGCNRGFSCDSATEVRETEAPTATSAGVAQPPTQEAPKVNPPTPIPAWVEASGSMALPAYRGPKIAKLAALGSFIGLAVLTDGRVYSWGWDLVPGTLDEIPERMGERPQFRGMRDISIGTLTCGIWRGSSTRCWGLGFGMELEGAPGCVKTKNKLMEGLVSVDDDDPPSHYDVRCEAPTSLTLAVKATSIAVGGAHACVLGGDGSVWCWGSLASDDNVAPYDQCHTDKSFAWTCDRPRRVRGLPTASRIAIFGGQVTCALTSGNQRYCWGDLNGTNMATFDANDPTDGSDRGPVRMAPIVPDAVGLSDPCTLTKDRGIVCSYTNHYLTPPIEKGVTTRVRGVDSAIEVVNTMMGNSSCARLAEGKVICWGVIAGQPDPTRTRQSGDSLEAVPVPGVSKASSLAVGHTQACAVLADGGAYCWGARVSNEFGDAETRASVPPLPLVIPQ